MFQKRKNKSPKMKNQIDELLSWINKNKIFMSQRSYEPESKSRYAIDYEDLQAKLIHMKNNADGLEAKQAILNAIWTIRWSMDKKALKYILTQAEAKQACEDILDELNKSGYEVVRRTAI